jgi:peroxiredoxin
MWAKRIEVATNVAILIAFLLVALVAVQRLRAPSAGGIHQPTIGEKVSLRGVDWSKSGHNLVLALSTGCHFCSESADFYRSLVPSAVSHGVRVLAVLPQPATEGQSYLQKLGVAVPEVLQSPLESVEVSGTPTLLLLDAQGRIQKAWVGKLRPEQEQQVVASLQ